jgi:outer membrane protein TolC
MSRIVTGVTRDDEVRRRVRSANDAAIRHDRRVDAEETMLIRRWVRLLAVALTLAPAVAHADPPLALDRALELALARNERALKAPFRVEAAAGAVEKARAAFLPTPTAGGQGTMRASADRNGRILAGTGTFTLTQPILNVPAIPLYAQAKHNYESERWGAIEDKRQLAYDTAHAFLQALASERLVEAAGRRLDRAKATLVDTRARAEAGLTSTNDVTRGTVDLANAETQVTQARGNLDRAYLELAFLVGEPVTGPLAPPERTTSAAQQGAFRGEDILRFAESKRPDVQSSHEKTIALRESAKEPLYRTIPTLSAQAVMHATVAPLPPDVPHDEQALLTLSWTLYDAGARYGDDRTRGAQAESQALDERLLRRSIGTDVAVALAGLRTARDTFRIAQDAVVAAKQNTDETEILYKQGLARAIELTDANATRYDAEVNEENARLGMEQAYLALRQAIGLGPIGEDVPSSAPPPQGGAR